MTTTATKTIDEQLKTQRYQEAHLDAQLVAALQRQVSSDTLGLWTRDADGHIHPAEKHDLVRAIIVPMVPVFLLFFFRFFFGKASRLDHAMPKVGGQVHAGAAHVLFSRFGAIFH